ncbi:hypothetical protein ACSQ67_009954 [Phaseolus vulgaris]
MRESFGNQLDVKEAKASLLCGRDHDVIFFDNVKVYANGHVEENMGHAIWELEVLIGKYKELYHRIVDLLQKITKNLATRSLVDDVLRKVDGLKPILDERGVPLSQLVIAWCVANPNVSSAMLQRNLRINHYT